MTVVEARNLIEANKKSSIDNVLNIIYARIEEKSKKGWNRMCISEELPQLFTDYDTAIISEAYVSLRENGFKINSMTHFVIWG